jgi:hypothetical protein
LFFYNGAGPPHIHHMAVDFQHKYLCLAKT